MSATYWSDSQNLTSAFHPSGIDKSSTNLLAGVKAGRVHLCRVAVETQAGCSHLLWHNFVTVRDSWIKICILA